jgi:ferric-dicitrate binding protein FerR (iron transport regulator)
MKSPADSKASELEQDGFVRTFSRLAHEQLPSEPAARDRQQSFSRLEERLAAGRAPGKSAPRWVRGAGFALAALVLLSLGSWSLIAARRITYRVENAQIAADGRLLGGKVGSALHFSDGSQVSLLPGAQTTVGELTAHGGRVRIEEGTAHVAIAHLPGAAWSVLAGPYSVRVTGTAFDIGWVAAEQCFDISMQSGSVVITGPLTPQGVVLIAGQHLQADRALVVAPNVPAAAAPLAPDSASSTEPALTPPAASAATGVALRGAHERSWREQVAQGDFLAVIGGAQRRGLSSTLSGASLEDLSALADAARYGHRPDLSRRALLAQRRRFPGTPQASDAAFFLGALAESQAEALDWFNRYLKESPQGAYASQALGRKLIFVYGQHRGTEARELATEYTVRYPNGPYASTARKVLADPLGTSNSSAGVPAVP